MTELATPAPNPHPSPGNPGPHPAPSRPSLVLPPGATDAHCHVFGPASRFPYAPGRTFTPVDVPYSRVQSTQRALGFERAVIVQSSGYGTDHRALLDALRSDPASLRGVALLGPGVDPAELDAAGVCGARLHFLDHLGGAPDPTRIRTSLDTIAEMGWHAEIHVQGLGIVEHAPMIAAIRSRVVIDHMARVDLHDGVDGPAVRALSRLLDRGNIWVKLSGADRVSLSGPPYHDAAALAALLVDRFPERVLWGTDFPHVNITGPAPDDGLLVDLLTEMAPTESLRHRLLVTNPTDLFGF
ncbi:amidohydrolase family protein [Actinoplanes sp. NPDC051851]|uniref:amidohydrolase family protein n=1 Tax=Actinoplanes sp. NPDC051851 TaxID=3154753 RepID=UPI0034279F3A